MYLASRGIDGAYFKSVLRIPMLFSIVTLPISVSTKSSLRSTSSPTLFTESMLAELLFLGRHPTSPPHIHTDTHASDMEPIKDKSNDYTKVQCSGPVSSLQLVIGV